MFLNDIITDLEKYDGMCFPSFVVDDFSESFLHSSIFSIKDLKST